MLTQRFGFMGIAILTALMRMSIHAQEATPEPAVGPEIVTGEVAEMVDAELSALVEDGFAGVFLVAIDDEVVLRQGYGLADREAEVPNTPGTLHEIGSIAKSFTQLAVLRLAEDGVIDLEAPISEYFPDVPEDKAAITVEQLLDHTSGLDHVLWEYAPYDMLTRDETLAASLDSTLVFEPGTDELYSNIGYNLLAILVELESGQSYESYVREHFLDPLGLTETFFWGEDFGDRFEAAYTNTFNDYGRFSEWPDTWTEQGAGAMKSTVDDLYRFHQAVLTDPFLSSVIPAQFGLGVAGGADFGSFSADYEYVPARGGRPSIVVIGLTNGENHPAEQVVIDDGLLDRIIEAVGN
jgi:CubicO group peptidase (beta-lactamase class C family)